MGRRRTPWTVRWIATCWVRWSRCTRPPAPSAPSAATAAPSPPWSASGGRRATTASAPTRRPAQASCPSEAPTSTWCERRFTRSAGGKPPSVGCLEPTPAPPASTPARTSWTACRWWRRRTGAARQLRPSSLGRCRSSRRETRSSSRPRPHQDLNFK